MRASVLVALITAFPVAVPAAAPEAAVAAAPHHRAVQPAPRPGDAPGTDTAPAAAPGSQSPPLSVENPASLGARFAVGLDVTVERMSGLDADSLDFEIEDAGFPLPLGDLSSLGYETELTLVGAQVPIALPRMGPVSLSLVLEGAAVDGDFDLFLPDGTPRSGEVAVQPASYSGDGMLLGAGIEATAALCPGCPAFVSSGYRFRTLRGMDVGTPGPSACGLDGSFALNRQSGEVDREDHSLILRLGWQSPGGRVAPYLGARGYLSETTVGVEIPPLFGQLPARARLDLQSDEVAGLAGLDVRLGRYAGRLEGVFGGDREAVLVKLVRGFGAPAPGIGGDGGPSPSDVVGEDGHGEPGSGDDPEQGVEEQDAEERRARADLIATGLAPELRDLHSRYRERRPDLETTFGVRGEEVYVPADVLSLMDQTEVELLEILDFPELTPLRAWVQVFFSDLRSDLPSVAGPGVGVPPVSQQQAPTSLRPTSMRLAAVGPAPPAVRAVPVQQPFPGDELKAEQEGVLNRLGAFLDRLFSRTEAGELATDLCLRSEPRPGVEVRLYPYRYPQRLLSEVTERTLRVVYRGLYAYEVEAEDRSFACTDRSCPLLDLWLNDGPHVVCNVDLQTCVPRSGSLERCEQP